MWNALREGMEHLPLPYFLIARAFDQLFHHADIGIRVPSVLALGAGLLVTFDIGRRLTDGLYGLIALSFLATPFVTYYGYEARPYALCFALAAIALWIWVTTKVESRTATVAFGAVFLMGVAIHYYFLLCLAPFGILALWERRIFHPKVTAGAVGAMAALVVLYPQIVNSLSAQQRGAFGDWALPSLSKLQAVYLGFFPLVTVPLVLIAVMASLGRSHERLLPATSPGERISWLFLSVPLAAFVAAKLVTHLFVDRYMIVAVPGIAVAVACLFWRHCQESRYLSLALLIVFAGAGINGQLLTLRNIDHIQAYGDPQARTRQMLALEDTLEREGKRHLAVRFPLLFLEAWYYSKHRERYGLVWYGDVGDVGNARKYYALNFISLEEVVANARQTAVIGPDPVLTEALQKAGLRLKTRFITPHVVYLE
jgi:hypothetical protein